MKTEYKIFTAFILNLFFAFFEFAGGVITGSVAIVSDAIHDLGDAVGIGVSFFLEKKSKKKPDETYTYGYGKFSVLGGLITTLILITGSTLVAVGAVRRIMHPTAVDSGKMIIFAVVGVLVNLLAAFFTADPHNVNQRAVNLHMLEDVLGWGVVLIGAIIIKITDISLIDPIMSLLVAVFIFINAVSNLKEILNIILEKIPDDISVNEIKEKLLKVDGVINVHHIHIRSTDGVHNFATMHIVTDEDPYAVKNEVRKILKEHGIYHATLETETSDEDCENKECQLCTNEKEHGSHHHHHHH